MAVIADFAAYPEWANGVRATEIVEQLDDGRARRVRFTLDAGIIKDRFVLCYQWDGDAQVRWTLDPAESGSVISELSGGMPGPGLAAITASNASTASCTTVAKTSPTLDKCEPSPGPESLNLRAARHSGHHSHSGGSPPCGSLVALSHTSSSSP